MSDIVEQLLDMSAGHTAAAMSLLTPVACGGLLAEAAAKIKRDRAQLAEAAAFLDGLASRLETCQGIIAGDPECPCQENAADCRAMVEKLRKGG